MNDSFFMFSVITEKTLILERITATMNKETRQFIIDHTSDDIHKLLLQGRHSNLVDFDLAIRQIAGRQKVKYKVPTFFANENILYPIQLSLEQSSSELTAQYKASLCSGGTLIDLTGGFGVDCFFMSNRFDKTLYVEKNNDLCKLARHNFNILNRPQIEVINSLTEDFIPAIESANWIYIDPARRNKAGNKVVLLSDCEPDISKLSAILLEKSGNIMVKLSPMIDISSVINELKNVNEVHVISIENECKEVVLILQKQNATNIRIKAVNLIKEKRDQLFEFNIEEEKNADLTIASDIENYLYEPNAAIMKSGAFKLICSTFNIKKLHKHTHLYTSESLIKDFPGRIFKISKIWEKKKDEAKKITQANISTRNYPLKAEELRKKLKIKDGGYIYLFACTIHNDKKVIIECKKVFGL